MKKENLNVVENDQVVLNQASNDVEVLRGFKFQTIQINQETKEEKVLKVSGTFYYCEQVATQEIKTTLGLYKYEIRKVSKKDTLIVETISYDDDLEIIVIR